MPPRKIIDVVSPEDEPIKEQIHPIPKSEPPLEEVIAEVSSPEVPRFGELQPKVDAHPLFSGTKEPAPKKRRWWKRTLAPLLALIVLLAILYLAIDAGLVKGYSHLPFHFFKAPVAATAPVITPAKTATTMTPAVTDPYAGWKSYSKNGYEFKYPSDWVLVDGQPFGTVNSPDFKSTGLQSRTVTSGITVYFDRTDIPQTNITADNYESSTLYGPSYSNFEKKIINNKSVVQFHISDNIIRTEFFRSDGTRVGAQTEFATENKDANLKTYDLILASVKY